MGCIGSPATATTRPPRNGPIHRQVRAPSKSDCAVVEVTMAYAPSSPALVLLLTGYPLWGEHPSMLTRQCQREGLTYILLCSEHKNVSFSCSVVCCWCAEGKEETPPVWVFVGFVHGIGALRVGLSLCRRGDSTAFILAYSPLSKRCCLVCVCGSQECCSVRSNPPCGDLFVSGVLATCTGSELLTGAASAAWTCAGF